jgi:hypothetical protein
VSFPGEGESPTFPLVRLAGAGLCLLFSNFRFGMAETGSIFYGDRFSRRPSACRVRLWKRVRVSVASDCTALRSPWIFATVVV